MSDETPLSQEDLGLKKDQNTAGVEEGFAQLIAQAKEDENPLDSQSMISADLNLPGGKTASEFLLVRPGQTPLETTVGASWMVREPGQPGHKQLVYEAKLERRSQNELTARTTYRTAGTTPNIVTDTPSGDFSFMSLRLHEPSVQTLANLAAENVTHYANTTPHDFQQISWLKQHGYQPEGANPTTFKRTYTPQPQTESQTK